MSDVGDEERPASVASPVARRGLVVRGLLLVAAATLLAAVAVMAVTVTILERQEYWCDDCPDLAPEVYTTDERFFSVVLLLAVGAVLVASIGCVVAVIRRSRRALTVVAVTAGLLLLVAFATAVLHWLLY